MSLHVFLFFLSVSSCSAQPFQPSQFIPNRTVSPFGRFDFNNNFIQSHDKESNLSSKSVQRFPSQVVRHGTTTLPFQNQQRDTLFGITGSQALGWDRNLSALQGIYSKNVQATNFELSSGNQQIHQIYPVHDSQANISNVNSAPNNIPDMPGATIKPRTLIRVASTIPQTTGHPTLTEPNANLLGQQFSASDVLQIQSNPIANINTYRQNQINYNPNQQNKTQEPNNFSSFENQVFASTNLQDSFSLQGIPIDVDDDHMSGILANNGGISHSAISLPVLNQVTTRNIDSRADVTLSEVGPFSRGMPIIHGARLPGKQNNQIHFASQSQSGIVASDTPIGSDAFDIQVSRKNVTLSKTENVNHSLPQTPIRESAHIYNKSTTLSHQQQGKIYWMDANNTSEIHSMNNLHNHDNYRLNSVGPQFFRNSFNNQGAYLTTFQNRRVVDQSLRVNISGNTFVNQQNLKSQQNEIDNQNYHRLTSGSANSVISTNTVIQPDSAPQEGQVNQTHAGFHFHNGSGNKNVMSRHGLESNNKLSDNRAFNMESNSQNSTPAQVYIGSRGDNLTFANIPFQTHLLSENTGSVINSKVFLDNGQVYPNQVEMTAQLPSSNRALEDISLSSRGKLELLPVTNIQISNPKEEPTRRLKLVRIESDAGDYFKWVHPTLSTTTPISDPEAEEEETTMTAATSNRFNITPRTTTTTTTTRNVPSKISCTADANSLTNGCANKKHSITNNTNMQNTTILTESLSKITSRNISKIEKKDIIRRIATKLFKIVSDSTAKAEPDAIGRVRAIFNKEVTPMHIHIEQPLTSKQVKPHNRSSENTTLEKTGNPVRLLHKPNKELNLKWIDASYGNHTLLEHSRKTSHIVPPTALSLPLSFAANNVPKISSVLNKDINEPLNVKTEPVLNRLEPGQQTLHRQIRLKSNSSDRPQLVPLNMQTTATNSQRAPSASTKIFIGPIPMKPNHSIFPVIVTDTSSMDKNSSNVLNRTRHIRGRIIRVNTSEESNKERVVRQQLREGNSADNNISLLVQHLLSASENGRHRNNSIVSTSINAKEEAPHVSAGTKSISLKMKSSADSGHASKHIQGRTIRVNTSEESNKERVVRQQLREGKSADDNISLLVHQPESASQNGRHRNNLIVSTSINAKEDAPQVSAGTKSISLKMKSSADSGHASTQNKIRNGVIGTDHTNTLKQDKHVSAAFTLEQMFLSAVNTETRTPPTSQSTYATVAMGLDSIMQIKILNNIQELRNIIERAVKLKTPDRLTVINLIRRLNHFTQTIRNTTASLAKQTNTATTSATIKLTTPTTTTNEGGENEMEEEHISSTVSTITIISSAGTTTENVGEIEVEAEEIISSTSSTREITTTTTTTSTLESEVAEVENEMEAEDLLPTTTPVRKVYSTKSITNTTTTPVYTNIFANTVKHQVGSVTSSPARNSGYGIYGQSYIAPEIKVLSAARKRNVPLPQLKNSKINSTKVAAGVNKILKAIGHEKQDNVDSTKIQLQKIGDTIVIKVTPVEKVNSSAVLDNRGILSPKINTGDHSQQRPSLDSTPQTISRPSTRFKIFKEMQMKKTNRPPSTPSTSMRSNETKPDIHQLSQLEIVETFEGNRVKTRPHQTTTHGHNGPNKHTDGQIRMDNANFGYGSHHNRQIQTTNGIRKQNPDQDIGSPQHKNKLRPKPLPVPQTQLKRFTNSPRPSQLNQVPAEPLKVKVNLSNIANNNKDSNDIKTGEKSLRSYYQHKVSETSNDISPNLHEKHGEVQNIPFSVIKRNETKPGTEMKLKTNLQKTLLPNAGQKKENLDRKINNDGTVSHQSSIYVGGNNIQTKSGMNKTSKITESVSHKRLSTIESQSVKLLPPQTFVSSSSALTKSTPISITNSRNDDNVSQNLRSKIANQLPSLQTQRKGLGIPFQNNAKGAKLGPHDVHENSQKAQMYSKDSGSNDWVKEGPRQISSEQGPPVRRLDPPRGNLSHPNRQRPIPRGGSPSTNGSKLKPESNDSIRHQRTTTTNSNLMPLVLSSPLRKLEDIRLKQVQGNIRTGKKNLLFLGHKIEMTTSLPLNVIPVSATEHPIKTSEEGLTDNLDNYEMTTIHEVINNLVITSEYDITTSASKIIMRANRLSGEVRDSFFPSQSVSVQRRRLDDTVQNSKPVHAMNSIVDAQKQFRQEIPSVRPVRQGRQMGPRRPRGPLIPYEKRNGATNRESYTGTSLWDAFSNRNQQNEFRPPEFAMNNRHNKMLPRMNMLRENPKLPTQPNVSTEEGGEEGDGGGGEGEGEGGSKTSTTTFDTFRYRNVGTSMSVPYRSSSPSQSVYPNYRNENYDQQSSRWHNNQQNWIQHRQPQRTSAWNKGQTYDSPTGNEYVERSRQDRRPLHSEISGYDKPAQYDQSSNFHNKATEQYNYNPHQRGGTNEYQGGNRRYSSGGMETSTLWNEYPHDRTETTTYSWWADDRIYTNNNAYNGNNVENQSSSASNFDHNNNLNKGHLQDRHLQTTQAVRWHDTTTRVYRNGDGREQRNQNEFRPTTTPSANNAW